MATTITPEELFFGAPASLTVGGVETGATVDAPKVSIEITEYTPDFQGARGPVKGTKFITKVLLKVALRINEFSATKLGWALPGSVAASGAGALTTAGHSQDLAADTAVGATVVKFPGVTLANPSAAADDIIDTVAAHGFTVNQRVRFESKTGGTGITVGTDYFVIAANLAATTLQVSLTLGGAAVDFSTDITAGVLIPAYTAGEFVRVGDSGEYEIREIATVGTSGAGGTGLTLDSALVLGHDTGDGLAQVDDAGQTTITWTPGRVPSGAYKDVILTGIGLDGRSLVVELDDAVSTINAEMEFGDTAIAGLPVEFVAQYDGSAPTVLPGRIRIG